jgi:competence protein ComEC
VGENGCLLKSIHDFSEELDMEITVWGRVADHVRFYGGRMSFSIRAEEIAVKDISNGLERRIKTDEVMPVRIKTYSQDILIRDDFIRFKCQVKNSGDFYYLYGYATGVERTSSGGAMDILFDLRSRSYNCIKCIFYRSLEYGPASLCEAIILGNTGNLPEKISSDFKKSGIYHLLAISGLHISFFILIISIFIKFISSKKLYGQSNNKWAGFAGMMVILAILFFYNFLIGGKASTVRSTMMSVYFLLAAGVGREIKRKTVLSYVFIILLFINPGFFTEPGFWLTFIAVFALVFVNKTLIELADVIKKKLAQIRQPYGKVYDRKHVKHRSNYFSSILVATFSVNIFILPVLLFIFKEASLLSLLTNLFAIPVFYMLLFILIISSILGLIWPPAGEILVRPSGILIWWLQKIAGSWRFFRFSIIKSQDFGLIHLIIYYIFLLSMLIIISRIIENWNSKKTS